MKIFIYQMPRSGAERFLQKFRSAGIEVCSHDFPAMQEEITSGRFNFQQIKPADVVCGLPITANYRKVMPRFPNALHIYYAIADLDAWHNRMRLLMESQSVMPGLQNRLSGTDQLTEEAKERIEIARGFTWSLFGEWKSYSNWWLTTCLRAYERHISYLAAKYGLRFVTADMHTDFESFLEKHDIAKLLNAPVSRIKHKMRSMAAQGISYVAARNEFVGEGRPERTPEMIKDIFYGKCQPCEHYQPDEGRCGLCSCHVHDGTKDGPNKLLWATTYCPDKPRRWDRDTHDPRTFNQHTPPTVIADTFFRSDLTFRDNLPGGFHGWDNVARGFRVMIERAKAAPLPEPEWKHERGIVICGGGWKFFPGIYCTVRLLRDVLNCSLPVQVWYLGARGEFDQRMADALRGYDVGWVDADAFRRENQYLHMSILGGWESKPLAAAYAPFREVVFMDADCYPAYDPERFLNHPEFRRVGAAFWPDGDKLHPGQWDRFGVPRHDEFAWESGQFVVDKSRHWVPLQLTMMINGHSDYVYKHIYGDKDTFHLAWRKCGNEVCVPQRQAAWHHVAFRCNDFDGNWLFIHRTRDKFKWRDQIDGKEPPRDYFTSQNNKTGTSFIADIPHERVMHQFLKESRAAIRNVVPTES